MITIALHSGMLDRAESAIERRDALLDEQAATDRFESVHHLIGAVELQRENFDAAIRHLEQADPDDILVIYHHAMALEGADRTDEANAMYEKIADWRFNDAALALVRAEATEKVGG